MKALKTTLLLILMLVIAQTNADAKGEKVAHKSPAVENVSPEPTHAPDVEAQYVGGDRELFAFVRENLNIPQKTLDAGIEGKVTIRVVITKEGRVRSARVIKGVGCSECDQEALRVVYAMPSWKPAQINGENVDSYCTIPVIISSKSEAQS